MQVLLPLFILICSLQLVLAEEAPIDWKTLATEFSENAETAEAKYQGKYLTVTGPVSSLAGGDMTVEAPAVAVTLSTQDGPGPDVKCLFENEDLEPGTQLHVTGDGSEVLLRQVDQSPGEFRANMEGLESGSRPFIVTGQNITVSGSFYGYQAGDIILRHAKLASTPE